MGYIIYDFPNVWNLPNLAELILRKWRRTRFPEHAVISFLQVPARAQDETSQCKKLGENQLIKFQHHN
jgi:hypothetical protein